MTLTPYGRPASSIESPKLLLGLREGEVFVFPVFARFENKLVHESCGHRPGHGAEPEEPVVRPDAGDGRGTEGTSCVAVFVVVWGEGDGCG